MADRTTEEERAEIDVHLLLLSQELSHSRLLRLLYSEDNEQHLTYVYSRDTDILSIFEEHDDFLEFKLLSWSETPTARQLADHVALYPSRAIIRGKMSTGCPALRTGSGLDALIRNVFTASLPRGATWTVGRGPVLYFLNRS